MNLQSTAPTTHSPNDLERIAFVSDRYEELQGLAAMPIGAMLATLGLSTLLEQKYEALWVDRGLNVWILLTSVVAALWLSSRFQAYYRRRHGVARRGWPQIRRHVFMYGLLAVLLIGHVVSRKMGMTIEPINLTGMVLGAAFLLVFLFDRNVLRVHYAWLGAAVLLCAVLARYVFHLDDQVEEGVVNIAAGVAIMIAGWLDHRLLMRAMPGIVEDDKTSL